MQHPRLSRPFPAAAGCPLPTAVPRHRPRRDTGPAATLAPPRAATSRISLCPLSAGLAAASRHICRFPFTPRIPAPQRAGLQAGKLPAPLDTFRGRPALPAKPGTLPPPSAAVLGGGDVH